MIITPTVGRVVWFRPEKSTDPSDEQPFAALVVYVWSDRMVNLIAFDHNGNQKPHTSVPLIQEGDERPAGGCYAEWMPYQVGQAKRHAVETEGTSN